MARQYEDYLRPENAAEKTKQWLATLAGSRGRIPLPPADRVGLVVVDPQRVFCDPASPSFLPSWPAALTGLLKLIHFFAAHNLPLAFTRHVHPGASIPVNFAHFFAKVIRPDDPLSHFAPPLDEIAAGHPVFEKDQFSAWSAAEFGRWAKGRDLLLIAGVQTQFCIAATAIDSGRYGAIPIVVCDATAAPDERTHLAALETLACGHAHVASTAEVLRHLAGPRQ